MILQSYIPSPKPETHSGKRITQPGLGVSIARAMQQYQQGTLENRIQGYYERQGMTIPDFSRLNKIERLTALNEFREGAKGNKLDLQKFAKKKEEEIKLSNLKKEEDAKQQSKASGNAGHAGSHSESK